MSSPASSTGPTGPFAVIPLRDGVLFPGATIPLTIGNPATLQMLQERRPPFDVFVVAQRNAGPVEPGFADLYEIGTVSRLHRVTVGPHGTAIALTEGLVTARWLDPVEGSPHLATHAHVLGDLVTAGGGAQAMGDALRSAFSDFILHTPDLPNELIGMLAGLGTPSAIANMVASLLPGLPVEVRQELLETRDVAKRVSRVLDLVVASRERRRVAEQAEADARAKVTKEQQRAFLREELHSIQRQLGDVPDAAADTEKLRKKLQQARLPPEVQEDVDRELARLGQAPAESAETAVVRTRLEWIAALPWNVSTAGEIDLPRAQQVLDEDHHGLERVKDRLIEYLAVLRLNRSLRGPILCLAGPPGVGKTSIGRSVARALGRQFVRVSLGGVRDEAEIRGHRRTYVAALPGQIMQGLRRAGASDPVLMLDEVDKLGRDVHGDPAAALMEVLDPEQNSAFRDHYLDVPFDLSRVLFITTANQLDPIQPALRDRLEVIELPGYSDHEKLQIARRYLVPRQVKENGLALQEHIAFEDAALSELIRGYTAEAGVRALERQIAALCRRRARQIASGERPDPLIRREQLGALLGPPTRVHESEPEDRPPGVAAGLAWTSAGGELIFVEAVRIPDGKGQLTATGQLGPTMQESVQAALSWVKAHAPELGISAGVLARGDIHVHVPAGGVPKDGPSAGLAMVSALASLLTGRPCRRRLAMTGEISLSGRVLPVGGLKAKVLAARREGIRELVLPAANEAHFLDEVSPDLREGLGVRFVRSIAEALELVLEPPQTSVGAVTCR